MNLFKLKLGSQYCLTLSILLAIYIFAAPVTALAAVSEGYIADEPFAAGTVVSVASDNPAKIVAATQENINSLLGVTAESNRTLIELHNNSANTQVITDGTAEVFVTNHNGTIQAGDLLSVSQLAGVAAKATDQPLILGTALQDFDPGNPEQIIRNVEQELAAAGIDHEEGVYLGRIVVDIEPQANPALKQNTTSNGLVGTVLGQLTDQGVSPIRIVTAFVVFGASIVLSSVITYSSVKNSVVAIGRNPLSKSAIYGGLARIFSLSVAILSVALLAVYLILTV